MYAYEKGLLFMHHPILVVEFCQNKIRPYYSAAVFVVRFKSLYVQMKSTQSISQIR